MIQMLNLIFNEPAQKPTYDYLKKIIGAKPTHYITTNQDGLFKKYFGEDAVSEIQGSWFFFQSPNTQVDKNLYPAKSYVEDLLNKIKDHNLIKNTFLRARSMGIPLSRGCADQNFLEDKRYYDEYQKFNDFIGKYKNKRVLFIEMGVGRMTPMFIQEPFWEITSYLDNSFYININPKDAITNPMIQDKSLLIGDDINEVLKEACEKI